MKRIVLVRGAAMAAAMLGGATVTAQPPKSITDSVTVTATIEAIDKTNRLVTLKRQNGKLVTVEVDTAVHRFDQLKVGDVIRATYYESIAINVRKPGDPVPKAYDTAYGKLPGDKPGAKEMVKETITVTVLAIDKPNKSVTVRRKDGSELSMRVNDVRYLDVVKPGDTVDITYARGLLLKAEAAR
jgi:hypothetical protein